MGHATATIQLSSVATVPLLDGKNAIIYGGGGFIGRVVARTFAREGANLFLAGRTAQTLKAVARPITDAGGTGRTAVVDVLDEAGSRNTPGQSSRKPAGSTSAST